MIGWKAGPNWNINAIVNNSSKSHHTLKGHDGRVTILRNDCNMVEETQLQGMLYERVTNLWHNYDVVKELQPFGNPSKGHDRRFATLCKPIERTRILL